MEPRFILALRLCRLMQWPVLYGWHLFSVVLMQCVAVNMVFRTAFLEKLLG
jgi:hypothetical protein